MRVYSVVMSCNLSCHRSGTPSGRRDVSRTRGAAASQAVPSPEVFLDDVYPDTLACTPGPKKKGAASKGVRSSPRKGGKNVPPPGNRMMQVDINVDPVTSTFRKTVGLSLLLNRKVITFFCPVLCL